MKYRVMAVLAIAVLSAPTQADELNCKLMTKAARVTMEARQVGVPMESLMDIAENDFHREVILDAFDKPKYHTKSMQEQATNEFAADFMSSCYRLNQEFADD